MMDQQKSSLNLTTTLMFFTSNSLVRRNTERPIAIAYKPTEPSNLHHHHKHYTHPAGSENYSNANYASAVISEIRDSNPSDQEHRHQPPITDDTDDFDDPSRRDTYRQEFQAPFYPSVNLDKTQNSIRNSWAIVTPPPAEYESRDNHHSQIDRSDTDVDDSKRTSQDEKPLTVTNQKSSTTEPSTDTTSVTAPFDPDKFQPEFQGGFKPIYPTENSLKNTEAEKTVASKSSTLKESIESLVYDYLGDDQPNTTTSN